MGEIARGKLGEDTIYQKGRKNMTNIPQFHEQNKKNRHRGACSLALWAISMSVVDEAAAPLLHLFLYEHLAEGYI